MKNHPSRIWCVAASLLLVGFGAQGHQDTRFTPPEPQVVVDPVISPFVVRGGTVVLRVTVSGEGLPTDIEVIRPYPALTEPVVSAVRQWRFTPAQFGQHAVTATITLPVHVSIVPATFTPLARPFTVR